MIVDLPQLLGPTRALNSWSDTWNSLNALYRRNTTLVILDPPIGRLGQDYYPNKGARLARQKIEGAKLKNVPVGTYRSPQGSCPQCGQRPNDGGVVSGEAAKACQEIPDNTG